MEGGGNRDVWRVDRVSTYRWAHNIAGGGGLTKVTVGARIWSWSLDRHRVVQHRQVHTTQLGGLEKTQRPELRPGKKGDRLGWTEDMTIPEQSHGRPISDSQVRGLYWLALQHQLSITVTWTDFLCLSATQFAHLWNGFRGSCEGLVRCRTQGALLSVGCQYCGRRQAGKQKWVGEMKQNVKKWQVLTEAWRTRDITSHIHLIGDPCCGE